MNSSSTLMPSPTRYQSFMWRVLLAFLMTSMCVIGSFGALGALVPALLSVPILLNPKIRAQISGQWGLYLFLAVFVALAITFFLTADEPSDIAFSLNFIALPLAVPVFLLARVHAGGPWPLRFATFALVGALAAFSQATYEVVVLGRPNVAGLASNANVFAHMALLLGFMGLVGFKLTPARWRYLFLLGPLLGLAATIMSGSRGALLSALPLMPIAFIYLGLHTKQYRRILVLALIALATLVAAAVATGVLDRQVSRFAGTKDLFIEIIETGDSSHNGTHVRLLFYQGAWNAFLNSPLVGHGWSNAVSRSLGGLDAPSQNTDRLRIGPHVHNDFLQFAAGAGIVGILSYFALLAAPFAHVRRADQFAAPRLFLVFTLVSFTILHGLIDAPFGFDVTVVAYVFLSAIIAGMFDGPANVDPNPPSH